MLLVADLLSHEQKLSESLDTALNSALSSMPSFTAKLMKSQQQVQGEGGCSTSWNTGSILGEQQMGEENRDQVYREGCAAAQHLSMPLWPVSHGCSQSRIRF